MWPYDEGMSHLPTASLGASSAGDWLSRAATRLIVRPDAEAEALAAIACLTATLEHRDRIDRPSSAAMRPLQPWLAQLPSQVVHLPPTHPVAEWLQLSALAEHHGEAALARLIVDVLAERLGEHHAPQRPPRGDVAGESESVSESVGESVSESVSESERRELLALCWTRRGRIARIAGLLDDARACYSEALMLAGQHWRDARLGAELGLANLAISRGNYPEVLARCSTVLADPAAALALADVHRVALYQMRAMALRRRGALLDALLDGWRAYDLLGQASAHRAELLVSMAETALESAEAAAARAAFAHAEAEARATAAPLRVVAAAVTGRACAALVEAHDGGRMVAGATHPLTEATAALEQLLTQPLAPRELAVALLTIAECFRWLGAEARATEALAQAERLASHHDFHDLQFRAEAWRTTAARPREAPSPAVPHTPAVRHAGRHAALQRLAALADLV